MWDFRLAACNHLYRTLSHSLSKSMAFLLRYEGLARPLLVYSLRMCIRTGSLSSSMSDSFSRSDSPSLIPELLAARAKALQCRGMNWRIFLRISGVGAWSSVRGLFPLRPLCLPLRSFQ